MEQSQSCSVVPFRTYSDANLLSQNVIGEKKTEQVQQCTSAIVENGTFMSIFFISVFNDYM